MLICNIIDKHILELYPFWQCGYSGIISYILEQRLSFI